MEHRRQRRQRASEIIRKQKRKELDARRSKCRIRIGSQLEQWCQLKEQLGFSLHSQLAKYLLDRGREYQVEISQCRKHINKLTEKESLPSSATPIRILGYSTPFFLFLFCSNL
uniref:Uncharacterized protein n=1 Tax=Naja naja TaxID=35670 RepID=A0A8C6VBY6_NAJNA